MDHGHHPPETFRASYRGGGSESNVQHETPVMHGHIKWQPAPVDNEIVVDQRQPMRRHIALMVAGVLLLAGCGVSHGEVDVITAERDALANQVRELQDQLEASIAAGAAVEKAERELLALTDSFEKLQANLDEWEDKAKAAELERDTARAEAEEAAAELAAVLLAYDDDIGAARARIAGAAKSFACTWGTDKAAEGEIVSTATGESILKAFAQSDAFDTLAAAPEIATAVRVAETLGADPYAADPEEIKLAAVGCWQQEDARLHSAAYDHQSLIREAVLEAACTLGASEVYAAYFPGYKYTAAYQNWQLTIGSEEATNYIRSVEDRFGSIEAFVAIPNAQIEAASDRCEDSRARIEPRSGGTWNVGSEIQPGTWNAYDVTGCYWALLSENGDIRGSHYGDGLRLSVDVLSSDGQFQVSGCTFFYANP